MKKKRAVSRGQVGAAAPGYDAAGHIDPRHAENLLAIGRAARNTEPDAFLEASHDDLAEELAEAAVSSMTTGQDELRSALDAEVEEERGGPFVETSGSIEFAGGTDESNIEEATREPFPTS
jgi:hypothetical protein